MAADIIANPNIINTDQSGNNAYGVKETVNDAENGVVDIQTGGKIDGAWGGYSIDGIAKTNQASLSGGEAIGVFGGASWKNHADNNQVSISAGMVKYNVTGGESIEKDATNNRVSITGGQMREVRGGFSTGTGSAKDNQVSISDGQVLSTIYGGLSNEGDATNNRVSIDGGTAKRFVYGGNAKHHANDNQVSINDGTMESNVYGGYSFTQHADNNQITISGGTVENWVVGGGSTKGTATNNHVSISGGTFSDHIMAGRGEETTSTVTDNTLTIEGGTFKETVQLSGYTGQAATTGGNSMHLKIAGLTIRNIRTFNNLYFYLPNSVNHGDNVVTLQALSTDLSAAAIGVCAATGSPLTVGDTVTLIQAQSLSTSSNTSPNTTAGMTGCSPDYEFTLEKVNNALIATVTKAPAAAPQQGAAQPVPGLGAKTLALLMLILAAITAWFIHRRSATAL